MRLIQQTVLHNPDNGKWGNCYQACIASILELPLEEVPHFGDNGVSSTTFVKTLLRFLTSKGYGMYATSDFPTIEKDDLPYFIASGISPRDKDVNHAIVMDIEHCMYDVHPDNTRIVGEPYRYEILFKLTP